MSIIIPANTLAGGFNVDNSCRFDRASSSAMSKSSLSGGSNTIGTVSVWLKRSGIGTDQRYWANYAGSDSDRLQFGWQAADKLYIQHGANVKFITTRVFRDVSAWYHVVVAIDSTEADNANRVKVYVNGVRETAFDTFNTLTEDGEIFMNNDKIIIGERQTSDLFYDGYLCEVVQLDGTAAAADSFGEFDEDSGIWKPIDVSGLTFGTNGFYLDFEASGNMGNDANGGTDFTESNIAAVEQSTDTCTNNFATVNPVDSGFKVNLSEGNLKFVGETADFIQQWGRTTFGVSRGKWYWEMTKIANNPCIGIVTMQSPINLALENNTAARCVIYCSGQLDGQDNSGRVNGIATSIADYADDDIVSCMMDLDNGFVYFAKNGTIQIGADDSTTGNPASGSSGTGAANPTSQLLTNQHDGVWSPLIFDNSSNPAATAIYNFGNPTVALSSGVADGNGFGNFEYAPPSGYFALCTKNLAEHG